MSLREKLDRTGARKLLALDGGGMRGIISVEILAAIEDVLRTALGQDEHFVLNSADHIADLSRIGAAVERQVRREHFDGILD